MAIVKDAIDVNVPAALAYTYWSRFEDFPKFMEEVEEIRREALDKVHWRAKVAGKTEEWDAKITDNIPSKRIAWRSTSGLVNNGAVEFDALSATATRIRLTMEHESRGIVEKVTEMLGIDRRRVHKNLESFKHYAESQKS